MSNTLMRPRDEKDNISISSNASATHRIFEGFLFEEPNFDSATHQSANNNSDARSQQPQRVCASWNSRNDFIHVTSTARPFHIYFDDIIATKKVGPANLPKVTESHNQQRNLFEKRPKALVLVNPFSGQKKALDLWAEHARPIFEEAGVPYQLLSTSKRGHASHIARTVDLDEFGALVVVSGDGLIAEVIYGLLTRRSDRERALRLPILHIPGGTGNGLAASVAFQCNEPFSAGGAFCKEMALMLAGGRPRYRPLRLYHVEMEQNVHMPMFMTMTWGLVADIDLGSERFRWAGLTRYHIEAFIRIARLPSVARYKGKISYLPVTARNLLLKTKLKATDERRKFGATHFECDDVSPYEPSEHDNGPVGAHAKWAPPTNGGAPSIEEAFHGTHLTKAPPLSRPVPSNWTTIEGEFVFVCLSAMSHLGSNLPYLPCTRLEEEIFYLTYVDWRTVKSRFHIAHLLLTIERGGHLNHPCFQTIPVMACRVEPESSAGGHVALDGEPCESGRAFQVVSTSLCATVVARQPRQNTEETKKKR